MVIELNKQRVIQLTPLSELPPSVVSRLPDVALAANWEAPNPILLLPKSRESIRPDRHGGHYFAGGLPALMQAVRKIKQLPRGQVTYVNDGQLRKSTQSAHQGHVHPTEWTIEECRAKNLATLLLTSLRLITPAPPEDVVNYSYLHFPLTSVEMSLFARFFVHRVIHTLLSKNGLSADDRWQCEAVRASLAFHKSLSDEIEEAGGRQTFSKAWRIMWSPVKESLEKKRALWSAAGIQTEFMTREELIKNSLFKEDAPIYALKVFGDGKFFPEIDQEIGGYLSKKYPASYEQRTAAVRELYIDKETKEPFALLEEAKDGTSQVVAIDSFFGSVGHNQVFDERGRSLWYEVPVTGVSTLWLASIAKEELRSRLGDVDLEAVLKQFVGTANHTNLHITIWDAIVDSDHVHLLARATQGANFNSELADPNDLLNMTANINRSFIGSWRLISAGTCIRKTAISNIPEMKANFIHGLSGIGFSFSGVPREMLDREPMAKKLLRWW